ncbi:hypothetical protein BDY24DRAFT_416972 [Mrakia frigida]|uniref:uncharacterized protein n=1 Tax=Mrakia frigida TaxID=29902 RepID=UPI003FCC1280
MPPRRTRSPSTSSESSRPSIKTAKLYNFAPLFDTSCSPSSDLVLTCLDGVSFALPRYILKTHCPAFEAILPPPPIVSINTPSSSTSRSRSAEEDDQPKLQPVNLNELSTPFELFLRHTIPSKYMDLDGSPPKFPVYKFFADIVVLENVLDLAYRYQLPLVFDVVSRIQLSVLNKTSPLRGFAIAARFGRLEDARESIRGLCHRKFQHPGARKFMVESGTWLDGWREPCLGDLALATLVYVPMSAVRNFTIVHARVVSSQDGSYTWLTAAEESPISQSCFSPLPLSTTPLSRQLLQNLRFALDPVGTQLILILFWTSTFNPYIFLHLFQP